jgi:ABC-2 type transport system ATP-binding protein
VIAKLANAAIELRGVTRSFGSNVAVNQLSLKISPGEIFALVGPDGAGKTTLIRLICGALSIDEGALSVGGVDVVAQTATVQASLGYMPQRFSLYPDLSVMENLQFYGDIFGVPANEFKRISKKLLEEFSLWSFRTRLAEELSGGMKQKLALACTLAHSPAILLLDEPTAGVDPSSRREFWRILYRINRNGTTVFVSTPYMDEADRANRIGFILHGSLVDCGTPEELKGALRGEVVQITCSDRAAARRALRDESCVRSVEVFGETLHALVVSAATTIPALEQGLVAYGVHDAVLTKIQPTLEDAFVARLTA